MNQNPQTILGISPGTRSLGIGVMRDRELLDARIKTFPGKWSEGKRKAIMETIAKLLNDFNVTTVALKTIHLSRSSTALNQVIYDIKDVAEKRKLKFVLYTINELKEYCSGGKKGNKKVLTDFIAHNYPELSFECSKEKNSRNKYYIKLFESVVCTGLSANQLI